MPKSIILTCKSLPSESSSSTFSSDRSRWAIPKSCSQHTAVMTCVTMGFMAASRTSTAACFSFWHHVNRSPRFAKVVMMYACPNPKYTPRSLHAHGKCRLLRCLIMPMSIQGRSGDSGCLLLNSSGLDLINFHGNLLTATVWPGRSQRVMRSTTPCPDAAEASVLTRLHFISFHFGMILTLLSVFSSSGPVRILSLLAGLSTCLLCHLRANSSHSFKLSSRSRAAWSLASSARPTPKKARRSKVATSGSAFTAL
mmetsp:Transcript_9731/g.17135  ORF Transcript_9731/g.17135 Transcript_9731/m.17135 type:complete len:254 (+) Transcript_9731:651-1412(+)